MTRQTEREAAIERLQAALAELDRLGESIAAAHVSAALDSLLDRSAVERTSSKPD